MAPTGSPHEAIVGISVELLEAVLAQVATLPTPPRPDLQVSPRLDMQLATDPIALAQKVVQNLFNFLSSFEAVGNGVFVRMADLERWYERFVQKIKNQGLQFLDSV